MQVLERWDEIVSYVRGCLAHSTSFTIHESDFKALFGLGGGYWHKLEGAYNVWRNHVRPDFDFERGHGVIKFFVISKSVDCAMINVPPSACK